MNWESGILISPSSTVSIADFGSCQGSIIYIKPLMRWAQFLDITTLNKNNLIQAVSILFQRKENPGSTAAGLKFK